MTSGPFFIIPSWERSHISFEGSWEDDFPLLGGICDRSQEGMIIVDSTHQAAILLQLLRLQSRADPTTSTGMGFPLDSEYMYVYIYLYKYIFFLMVSSS